MKKRAKVPSRKAKAMATPAKRPVNPAPLTTAERKHTPPAPPSPPSGMEQAQAFEKAMTLFRRQEFAKARDLFRAASRGPATEMTHSALMYVRMCDRRLAGGQVSLDSPDDYYNYGITLMNQRRMEEAEEHLRALTARQQRIVLDTVDRQLLNQPTVETRNRKPMRPNPIAPWELRIGDLREYYEVSDEYAATVTVLAIGIKERSRVKIGGEVIKL